MNLIFQNLTPKQLMIFIYGIKMVLQIEKVQKKCSMNGKMNKKNLTNNVKKKIDSKITN